MTEDVTMTLNGVAVDVSNVEFNLTVMHGRSGVTDPPTASSAQLVMRGSAGPVMEISDVLTITSHGEARFNGKISDLDVAFIQTSPPTPITTVIAMGNLSELGLADVGASGYAEQTARQRVETILASTDVAYLNGGDAAITLKAVAAVDAVTTTAWDGLSAVAVQTGALFFDDPDGRVIFEDYGNRGLTNFEGTWSAQTSTWAAASGTWASFPTEITSTSLDSSGVVFNPVFTKTLEPLINSVTVGYGTDQTIQQEDSASIAAYGRREYLLNTEIKTLDDATERGANIITAQANPLWNLGQITILIHELDATQTTAVLKLVSGSLVIVNDLPAAGPYDAYEGIVEGWSDSYDNGNHTLTLSISDPRFSYQTLLWSQVLPELTWTEVDAAAQWFEIVSNNDLVGV